MDSKNHTENSTENHPKNAPKPFRKSPKKASEAFTDGVLPFYLIDILVNRLVINKPGITISGIVKELASRGYSFKENSIREKLRLIGSYSHTIELYTYKERIGINKIPTTHYLVKFKPLK